MISEPIALTANAEVYSLARTNQDNNAATYYDVSADGLKRFTMNVKHTLPAANGSVESHLCRCDIENLDANGAVVRTDSVWLVFRTSSAAQDATELEGIFTGMVNMLQASVGAVTKAILGRQS